MSRLHLASFLLLCSATVATAQSGPKLGSKRPERIKISWPESGHAIGYGVWRKGESDERWRGIANLGPEARSHVDSRVTAGAAYRYRVDVTTTGRPIMGEPLGPVTALASFYVRLRSVEGGVASVVVHKWDAGFSEWLKSDPQRVKIGEQIGSEGMMSDFRTGARLKSAGISSLGPSVHTITFETRDRRSVTVTTRDALPRAVLPQKKKTPRKVEERQSGITRTRPTESAQTVVKEGALPFPEPRRAGTAPGKRVYWEITNSSEVNMNVLILGKPGKRGFQLGPGKSYMARLKRGGKFVVSVQASQDACRPLYGEFSLVSGTKYSSNLKIMIDPKTKPKPKPPPEKP